MVDILLLLKEHQTVINVTVGDSPPLVLRVLRAEQGYMGRVSLRVASSPLPLALKDSQVRLRIFHR